MKRASASIALACAALAWAGSEAQGRRTGAVRSEPIDMVVIHSTGGPTCDARTGKPVWVRSGTLDANMRFIEAHPTLGIHYMIGRDGTLRASVPEGRLAHHVFGFSGRSIAIELVNDGNGIDPFPDAQLAALVTLLRDITARRGIGRDGVRLHSELDTSPLPCDPARRRKVDPGAAFPRDAVLDRVFKPQ
jgi:N-acetylmuramoyl-L-alanine amidase